MNPVETSRLSQLVTDQLSIESTRIYKLLRAADGITAKLQRTEEKLKLSRNNVERLTSDNIRSLNETKNLTHKLELSRVSIQRNNEQHAIAVQALQKNWGVERRRYQQQIEELRNKNDEQNDRDRRRWARKSFSLPPSSNGTVENEENGESIESIDRIDRIERAKRIERTETKDINGVDSDDKSRRNDRSKKFITKSNGNDNNKVEESVALHPNVSFDAWGSEESASQRSVHTSFDDAWASGGSGDSQTTSSVSNESNSLNNNHTNQTTTGTIRPSGSNNKLNGSHQFVSINTTMEDRRRERDNTKNDAFAPVTTMPTIRSKTVATALIVTAATSTATSTATPTSTATATATSTPIPSSSNVSTKIKDASSKEQKGRPRFYSATEEEEEGATVILLDSMIQSPDFSYFDNRGIKPPGRIAPSSLSPSPLSNSNSSNDNNADDDNDNDKDTNRSTKNARQQSAIIRRPRSAPPPINTSDGTITTNVNTSQDKTIIQSTFNHYKPDNKMNSSGTNSTNIDLTERIQTSKPSNEYVKVSLRNQYVKQDSSLSLGDDNKSLLLRLLLAPEMTLVSAILAAVPPRSKALLQNPLMRLFASHGKVARLLQWSIDLEVSSTQSPTTLFRSDSYGSRMLSMFTKNVGGSYLRHVLSPTLRIVADNADSLHRHRVSTFEVRQQTIDDFGGAPNAGATNLTKLIAQVDCVIESVVRAERKLPQSFRHLCHYLFGAVTSRFQDSGHNAVGALLFLRFLCPALASPEAFGISMPRSRSSSPAFVTRGPNGIVMPSPAERRSKVLITKLLQKVVSGIPFSEREPEMIAANSFVMEKHEEIKRMLLRVCVSDSTYDSMETAVTHDWKRYQQQGLKTNEAMRTVRSLLVQNVAVIDDMLPPVAFVLRRQFREALSMSSMSHHQQQQKKTKKKKKKNGNNGKGSRKNAVSNELLQALGL